MRIVKLILLTGLWLVIHSAGLNAQAPANCQPVNCKPADSQKICSRTANVKEASKVNFTLVNLYDQNRTAAENKANCPKICSDICPPGCCAKLAKATKSASNNASHSKMVAMKTKREE